MKILQRKRNHIRQHGGATILVAMAMGGAVLYGAHVNSQRTQQMMASTQVAEASLKMRDLSQVLIADVANMIRAGIIIPDGPNQRLTLPPNADALKLYARGNGVTMNFCVDTATQLSRDIQPGDCLGIVAAVNVELLGSELGGAGDGSDFSPLAYRLQMTLGSLPGSSAKLPSIVRRFAVQMFGGATSSECPFVVENYWAPAMFHWYGKRNYSGGWTRMEAPPAGQRYTFNASAPYQLSISRMQQTFRRKVGKETMPRSNANRDVRNYTLRLGGWGYTAHLYIPTADPSQCYWGFFMFRRRGIGQGCFAEGTAVTLADGTQKAIETIGSEDFVLNPVTGNVQRVLKTTSGTEIGKMYEVFTKTNSISVTADHPFVTSRGLLRADELRRGDSLILEHEAGSGVEVTKIRSSYHEEPVRVYNLHLVSDGQSVMDHIVLANGIPSGDLKLQKKIRRPFQKSPVERLMASLSLKAL